MSELTALNRDQVDLKRCEFMVRGKGKKPRIVFLSDRAVTAIGKYMAARDDNFDPLFFIIGFSFAMLSTLLAGYLPSKKARKIGPVRIIRGQ